MQRFLILLRDPLWQAIGVFVSVLTLFISSIVTTNEKSELSLIHYQTIDFSEYYLPDAKIKLLIQGTAQNLDAARADYFTVTNLGTVAIQKDDFDVPVTLQAGKATDRILFVESCATPIGQSVSSHGSVSRADYVKLNWKENRDGWSADPALMNAGDAACLVVVSIPAVTASPNPTKFVWNARVRNVPFKAYGSYNEFYSSIKRSWADYVVVGISLDGIAVYWFILLQAVLFGTSFVLATVSNWWSVQHRRTTIRAIVLMLLSTSSAEIMVDVFINRRGAELHPAAFPLLLTHISLLIYFTFIAVRARIRIISP
jgi:hypothetical protein